jgi:hypothetical protein
LSAASAAYTLNGKVLEEPMADVDAWGRDPSVKSMRRVFSEMEIRQKKLLKALNISFYDPRLRFWRERALSLFESAWAKASRQGILLDEEKAGELYVGGLLKILQGEGIVAPESSTALNTPAEKLPKEETI